MPSSPGRPPKDHVRLGLHVPPYVKQALRIEAAQRGVSISEIVVESLLTRGIIVNPPPATPAPKKESRA
jgi:hypothetical protein